MTTYRSGSFRRIFAVLLVLVLIAGFVPMPVAKAAGFEDTQGHWASSVIDKWSETYGVINGYPDGGFGPDDPVKRGQFATILNRVMKFQTIAQNSFTDLDESSYYRDDLLKLYAAKVINGTGPDTIDSEGELSREQAFTMLSRLFGVTPDETALSDFSDAELVSSWARGAVGGMIRAGYVQGSGGMIAPDQTLTRAQAVQVLDNIVKEIYSTAGTFTTDCEGVVIVNTPDAVLTDSAVSSLIITPGVGSGDFTMSDCEVDELIVMGGGVNSIHVNRSRVRRLGVRVDSSTGNVRISADSDTQIGAVNVEPTTETVYFAGGAEVFEAEAGSTVVITGDVENLTIVGENVTIVIAEGASVSNLEISGADAAVEVSGTVTNLNVKGSGSKIETAPAAVIDNVVIEAGGTKITGEGKVSNVTVESGEDVEVSTPNTTVTNNTDSAVSTGDGGTVDPGKTETTEDKAPEQTDTPPPNPPSPPVSTVTITDTAVLDATHVQVTLSESKAELTETDFLVEMGQTNADITTVRTVTSVSAEADNKTYTLTLSSPITAGWYVKVSPQGSNLAAGTVTVLDTAGVIAWDAAPITTVAKSGNNPPYQLMQINYDCKSVLTSTQAEIKIKTAASGDPAAGTVICVIDGAAGANPDAYFRWSYRDLSAVMSSNGGKVPELQLTPNDNNTQLKAGTVVTITITAEYDSKTYTITRDYTITSADVSASNWVAVPVTAPVTATPSFDATAAKGAVKFDATLTTEGNTLYISDSTFGSAPNLATTDTFDPAGYTVIGTAPGGRDVTNKLVRAAGRYALVEVNSSNNPVAVGTVDVTASHIAAVITVTNPNPGTAITGYALSGASSTFVAQAIDPGASTGNTITVPLSTTGSVTFYTGTATAPTLPTSGRMQSINVSFTNNAQTMTIANANWSPLAVGTLTVNKADANVAVAAPTMGSGSDVKYLLADGSNAVALHGNIVLGAKTSDADIAGTAWNGWLADGNGLNVYANNTKYVIAVEVEAATGFVVAKGISAVIGAAPAALRTVNITFEGINAVADPADATDTRKIIIHATSSISAIVAGTKITDAGAKVNSLAPDAWTDVLAGANVSGNRGSCVIVVEYDAQGWITAKGISAEINVVDPYTFTAGEYEIVASASQANEFSYEGGKIYGWGTQKTEYSVSDATLYSLITNLKTGDKFTLKDSTVKLETITRKTDTPTATASIELDKSMCETALTILGNANTLTVTGDLTGVDVTITGGAVDVSRLTAVKSIAAAGASTITAGTHGLTVDDAAADVTLVSAGTVTITKGTVTNGASAGKSIDVTAPANKVTLAQNGSVTLDADNKVTAIKDAALTAGVLNFKGAGTTVTGTLTLSGGDVDISDITGADGAQLVITSGTITHTNLYYAGGEVAVTETSGANVNNTYTWSTDRWVSAQALTPITELAESGTTGTTQAVLTWPAAAGATKVELFVTTTSDSYDEDALTTTGTIKISAELSASSVTTTVTGLSANTQYYFKLVVTGGKFAGDSNKLAVHTADTIVSKTVDVEIPAGNNTIVLEAAGATFKSEMTEITGHFSSSDIADFNVTNFTLQRVSDTEVRIIRNAGPWSTSAVTSGTITVEIAAQLTGGTEAAFTPSYGKYFKISGLVSAGTSGVVNLGGIWVDIYLSTDTSQAVASIQTADGGMYTFPGFFDASKTYQIKLRDYTSTPAAEVSSLTSNKTDANLTITLPTLAAPEITAFGTDGIVKWNTVPNATSYKVTLTREGDSATEDYAVPQGALQHDLLSTMHSLGLGTYSVKVTASASGYNSEASGEYGTRQTIKQLAVTGVAYSGSTKKVTWQNLDNDSAYAGYTVTVYRDTSNVAATYELRSGAATEVNLGTPPDDGTWTINTAAAGTYTVTVTPRAVFSGKVYTTVYQDGSATTPAPVAIFAGSVTVNTAQIASGNVSGSGALAETSITDNPVSINPGNSAQVTANSGVTKTTGNNANPFKNTYTGYILKAWTIEANTTPAASLDNANSGTVTLNMPSQVTEGSITLKAEYETAYAVPFYVAKQSETFNAGHILGDSAKVDVVEDPSFSTTGLVYFVTKETKFNFTDNSRGGRVFDYEYKESKWVITTEAKTYNELTTALNGSWGALASLAIEGALAAFDVSAFDPMALVTSTIYIKDNLTGNAIELTEHNAFADRGLTIQGDGEKTFDFGIRVTHAVNVKLDSLVINLSDNTKRADTADNNSGAAVLFEGGNNITLRRSEINVTTPSVTTNNTKQPICVGAQVRGAINITGNVITLQNGSGGGYCAGIYAGGGTYQYLTIENNQFEARTPLVFDMTGVTSAILASNKAKITGNTLTRNSDNTYDVRLLNLNSIWWAKASDASISSTNIKTLDDNETIGDYFDDVSNDEANNLATIIDALRNGKDGFNATLAAGQAASATIHSVNKPGEGNVWSLSNYQKTALEPAISITAAEYQANTGLLILTTDGAAPATKVTLRITGETGHMVLGGMQLGIWKNVNVPEGITGGNADYFKDDEHATGTGMTLGDWYWHENTLTIFIGKAANGTYAEYTNDNSQTETQHWNCGYMFAHGVADRNLTAVSGWYSAGGYSDGAQSTVTVTITGLPS